MTSLCSQYYQFFLAQALLLGVGISFLFCPAIATISLFFKINRGLAMGIAISGSSLGGVIWPITLNKLFEKCGFAWAMRIAGFIMVPLLLVACLTIRVPKLPSSHRRAEIDLSCSKNPVLIMLMMGFFLNYLTLFTPFFYISSYARHIKIDSGLAFYMVAVMNAASLFGRILPGILSDYYGHFNLCILAGLVSAIISLCWTKVNTVAGLLVFSMAYGFASGVILPDPLSIDKLTFLQAILGLQGACTAQVVDPRSFGSAIGLVFGAASIAYVNTRSSSLLEKYAYDTLSGLIGSPISGILVDKYGYLSLSIFSGMSLLAGSVMIICARFSYEPRWRVFV
jgi:MFS family permease